MRPQREHSPPLQPGAAGHPVLVWAVGARRAAIEEAAGPFDSNPTVTLLESFVD